MKEHSGHEDLQGLGHQSIIPYIYGRMQVLFCVFFKLALNWLE
jgi:hypothetical protein